MIRCDNCKGQELGTHYTIHCTQSIEIENPDQPILQKSKKDVTVTGPFYVFLCHSCVRKQRRKEMAGQLILSLFFIMVLITLQLLLTGDNVVTRLIYQLIEQNEFLQFGNIYYIWMILPSVIAIFVFVISIYSLIQIIVPSLRKSSGERLAINICKRWYPLHNYRYMTTQQYKRLIGK